METIASLVEQDIAEYEERNGPLPAHNKAVLRAMQRKEHEWWASEEGRVLNDNNRYQK
jgi:hypothetical protein